MTSLQSLINENFTVFTFTGISTYLNNRNQEKKKPNNMPTWKNITKDNFLEYIKEGDKGSALITGHMSGITVIDFDDIDVYNNLLLEYSDLKKIRTIKTKNGVHLYCQYDKSVKTTTNAFVEYDKIDIRNDDAIVFCPPMKYKLLDGSFAEYKDLGGEILPIPEYLLKNLKQNQNQKIERIEKPEQVIEKIKNKDTLSEEMVNLQYIEKVLRDGYLNHKATSQSYDDWRDIGFIFKHTSQSDKAFELFCEFSQLNDKIHPSNLPLYDEKYTKKFWEKIKQTDKKPLTIKSLKSIVKEQEQKIQDANIDKRKNENSFVDNDNDACDIIFENLKNTIIFVNDRYYYKYKNCWINNKEKIKSLLIVFITEARIFKINDKYDLKPYGQNTKTAKNIMELLLAKIRVKCDTKIKYESFHSSTKKRLCFLDGVLDFEKKKFTLWEDIVDPIYTTIIIQRNYAAYYEQPDRVFINKIKDDIFSNLFGTKTTLALNFFSRAVAGCNEDKNFMSYSGNRNCGKGILYQALSSAFEEYVTSFALENMVCKRESNKSSDIAKENAWLLPLEFARIALAQETDENENDNIKNGLKISNKVMKSVMSGGDEIKARPLYSDPINITLDATLGFFGNNELAISGEDSNQHHFKFTGVKQFITAEKYKSYESMGEEFLSAYAIRVDDLKEKVRTDDYTNAMVYLLFENFVNKSLTVEYIENEDGEQVELSIRALIFKHYEITKNEKDRVSKDEVFELLKKDKTKIKAELKQLNCVGGDTCKITIEKLNDEGETIKKQIPAFKNLKRRDSEQ